jgi:hypothetical protein
MRDLTPAGLRNCRFSKKSKTDRGCRRFKDRNFLYWQRREICHIHVTARQVRDQAQGLVDALSKLDPRLLQPPCIDGSHPAQQKSIINRDFRCKNF